jgi:hypothetical protein
MRIEQRIDLRFLVKVEKKLRPNQMTSDALESANEKSKNKQTAMRAMMIAFFDITQT